MASGKKKADVVAAQRTAATTTSSPSSRCVSTAATAAATTPPPSSNANHNNNGNNNNYAAPHTPIASAKRPRDRRRQSSRSSRLTPKRSSSSSCSDGKENHNGGNDYGRNDGGVENEGDDRCSAAGANAGASSSASSAPSVPTLSSSSSSPMSPMHPARPTPRDCHHVASSHPPHHHPHRQRSRDDDNGGAAASSATTEEEEEEVALGSGGGAGGGGSHHERTRSWVGSKVDAIFSPVLNFLHGPTTTGAAATSDSEGEDRRRLRQREPTVACDSEGSAGGNGAERKVTEETVDVLDEDGDVSMAEPPEEEEEEDSECREDLRREQRASALASAAVYEGHVRSTQTTTYTATTTMTNGSGAVTSATATTDTTTTVIRKSSDVSAASSSASSHPGTLKTAAAAIEDARIAMDRYLQEDLDVERSDVDDECSDEGAYCRRGHYPTQHRRQRPHHRQQQQQHVEESSSEEEEEEVEDQELEESIDEDEEECEEEEEEEEFNPYLFIKSLPHYSCVVPHPTAKICLPPKHPRSPPISLVLDLDETLVHCTVEPTPDADMVFPVVFNDVEYRVHVRTRPYLKEFLEMVRNKFEVIVFTASQRVYADELLDRIDPGKKYIKHRMFRESCLPVEGNYLKDLNVLGRDLSKSVLVDNSPHAFGYQVDNGIPIESWFDDPNDTELLKLERFLRTLHDVEDVRDAVRDKFQTFRLIMEA